MTSNLAKLRPRGSQPELPHLPMIGCDPLDDAREVLAAFSAKQSGSSDIPYADLAESMAPVLKTLLAMLVRSRRRELTAGQRLPLEQARQFLDEMALMPRTSDVDCGRLIGRFEVHLQRAIDLVDALVQPW
jgi:hypothetical protein